jgi:uncharacterized membrane protein (UPF0127 family)
MNRRTHRLAIATALWILCSAASNAAADNDELLDLATFAQSTVDVGNASRVQHFSVWVADTAARQTQGLMYVRDLPAGRGMLFLEPAARPAVFWMKNTYIPLDMLFVGPDHRIVKIAARAPPLSLATISSDAPVIAILEIKGGEAQRRSIRLGDRVTWP